MKKIEEKKLYAQPPTPPLPPVLFKMNFSY